MNKPTGKLAFAYQSIVNLEAKNAQLEAEVERLGKLNDTLERERRTALRGYERLRDEVERLRKDRKACWEEFKALVKSSNDNERYLHEEIDRLNKEADENTAEWGTVRLELAEAKAELAEAEALLRVMHVEHGYRSIADWLARHGDQP